MNTINKLLERFGYYKHKQEFTEDFLLQKYVELQDSIVEEDYPQKNRIHLFKDLSRVEGFRDYLRYTSNKDIQRYFASSNDVERASVRGAMARTVYMQGNLTKASDIKTKPDDTKGLKIKGLRYGK